MITHQHATAPYCFKTLALACSLVALTTLGACNKAGENETAGQKLDAAVTSTQKAAAEAKAKAETSMTNAGNAIKDATKKAEASGSKAGGSVDDVAITASVAAGFAKDADLSAIKIDVDTKNGNVTLYGPAPTAAARDRATTIAKSVKGVTAVDNKLVVKGS